jgi:hypothetical protein
MLLFAGDSLSILEKGMTTSIYLTILRIVQFTMVLAHREIARN